MSRKGDTKTYMPPDFMDIEACSVLNCSYFELMKQPAYIRNMALEKVSIERKDKAQKQRKAEIEAERQRRRR